MGGIDFSFTSEESTDRFSLANFHLEKCISIHIGQAGVRIGSACWELYCLEHGIDPKGQLDESKKRYENVYYKTFFEEDESGKNSPLSLFVDREPNTVDEIKCGNYRELFLPEQLITESNGAASTFAKGLYGVDFSVTERATNSIRKLVEKCDQFQGFLIFHSLTGGTGSGYTAALTELLLNEYGRLNKLEFSVYPSSMVLPSLLDPYNAVLSTHSTLNNSNCVFMSGTDNIFHKCENALDVEQPTLDNINYLLARIIASITDPIRYESVVNRSLSDIESNLVPFKRALYPLISYSPILPKEEKKIDPDLLEMTEVCFERKSQLLNCDPCAGKFIASCLLYRGNMEGKHVMESVKSVKRSKGISFASWCPEVFKVGINSYSPPSSSITGLGETMKSLCVLSNSTSIVDVWNPLIYRFDLMFQKRAYVHWYYSEGMEEKDFVAAYDDLLELKRDYEMVFDDRDL